MKKLTLSLEDDFSFSLIGISCHSKDYRLTFELDRSLETDFVKEDDLEVKNKEIFANFSFYSYEDEENYLEYFVISNKSAQGLLVPEEKMIDYFLMLKGEIREKDEKAIIEKLNKINIVLKAYKIDVHQLKSKRNLLF